MNINKILSFFRIKKPFKITEEELVRIHSNILTEEKETIEVIDLDGVHADISEVEELLLNIYEEAKTTSTYKDQELYKVSFSSLEHYRNLITSHPGIKKQLLFYLSQKTSKNNRSKSDQHTEAKTVIPENFKQAIRYHILNSRMHLTSPDFVKFLDIWKNMHPYDYPLRPLLRQLKKHTSVHKISPELNTHLHSFLRAKSIQYLPIKEYMDAKNIIHRILLDSSKISLVASSSVFLLLPDPFGTHVNKLISTMNEKYQHNFSTILNLLRYKINPKTVSQIDQCITSVDQTKFDTFMYEIIRKAAYLKLRSATLREKVIDSEKDHIYGAYEHMYKENIAIVKGLIQIAGNRKNMQCIQLIAPIAERCFAVALGKNYGPTSGLLGNACIHTLAHQFDNPGKDELRNLYQKTNFKRIKKQIEIASKKLEETTGESLV